MGGHCRAPIPPWGTVEPHHPSHSPQTFQFSGEHWGVLGWAPKGAAAPRGLVSPGSVRCAGGYLGVCEVWWD